MDFGRVKANQWDEYRRYRNEDEELLIFGYSCKLFRDDEKATFIDDGEHLIPWMGDSNLMIDRFDVRGALYDLKEAENKGKPFEETATEAELKEEQICDQERYFALYHDESQLQVSMEEEAKRIQVELASDGSVYKQVSFDYTPPTQDEAFQQQAMRGPQPQHVAEPVTYNPSSDEDIFMPPAQLNIPIGMEIPTSVKQNKIIVKTAKFIVTQGAQMEIVIKTKQAGNPMFNFLAFDNPLNAYYKHVVHMIRNGRYRWEEEPEGIASKNGQNDQYLHPNLSQSVRPDLTPGAITTPVKPSPHCAYSKLITKIREKQIASTIEDVEIPSPIAPSSPVTPAAVPVQDHPSTPVIHRSTDVVVGLVDYPSFNQTADGCSDEESEPICTKKPSSKASNPRSHTHDYRNIKWPPPELQMVIDKMASYIIKNGAAFEEVVRNRGDPRFEFLKESHEYYPYYQCKYDLYNEVYGDIFKNISKPQEWKKKSNTTLSKKENQHSKSNDGSRTISFSIKSREQDVSLTSHTTFPVESSTSEEDEEMDEEEREKRKIEREERRQTRRNKEEKERREREENLKREKLRKEKEEEEKRKMEKLLDDDSSGNEDLYDIFKYAQEMEQDKSNNGRADSPEESSSYSKQEERKKKAAAFLSKLKDTKTEKGGAKEEKRAPIYGPQMPPEIAAGLSRATTQSPTSSRASSDSEKPPPLPPPSDLYQQPPPPPPRSPSPIGLSDCLFHSLVEMGRKPNSLSREMSLSPKMKRNTKAKSNSMASALAGFNEDGVAKRSRGRVSESVETSNHKSRSHKKRSRQKSESRSPSRRERKKRKRSHGYRRKKRRSRSRSRSRGHSKSHRSSHKKKERKHSSHREREKTRKKKHKRHRSPSSASSLPSSDSSSRCTPSTLPSESESDMDVQVIESTDEIKRSSRGSSIVSLPSSNTRNSIPTNSSTSESLIGEKAPAKNEGSVSGGEESSVSSYAPLLKHSALPLFPVDENTNSSLELHVETEKKPLFNPNTSSAMAKIAQGLRAKLNALLEKESKLE